MEEDVFVEHQDDSVVLKYSSTGDVYSVWDFGKAFTGRIWDYFNVGPMLAENPGNILVLGLGGGTVVKQLLDFFNAKIEAVELSPSVVNMAVEHFNVKECERLRIHTADAMDFMKNSSKKYDVIIVDVFEGDKIPEKFTTQEFAGIVKEHLNERGIAVFNTITTGMLLMTSDKVYRNVRRVFPTVRILDEEGNRLVIALNFKASLQEIMKKIDSIENPIFEELKPKIKSRIRKDEP